MVAKRQIKKYHLDEIRSMVLIVKKNRKLCFLSNSRSVLFNLLYYSAYNIGKKKTYMDNINDLYFSRKRHAWNLLINSELVFRRNLSAVIYIV